MVFVRSAKMNAGKPDVLLDAYMNAARLAR
jgi:hypothetical protein